MTKERRVTGMQAEERRVCVGGHPRPVRATAKDPSNVDTARSPGMNRDFTAVDQADFRKPYSVHPRRGREEGEVR